MLDLHKSINVINLRTGITIMTQDNINPDEDGVVEVGVSRAESVTGMPINLKSARFNINDVIFHGVSMTRDENIAYYEENKPSEGEMMPIDMKNKGQA